MRSARLGGPAATDGDRIRLVLRKLEGVPWEARTARFVCVLAVALRGDVLATFEGEVEGDGFVGGIGVEGGEGGG